jgi:hypothetical protein
LFFACLFFGETFGVQGVFRVDQVVVQQFSIRKSFELQTVKKSEVTIQTIPGRKLEHPEQTAVPFPDFGLRPQAAPDLAKHGATALLDLIHQKRQQHYKAKTLARCWACVPIMMLKVVALILQRIERLVLDLPATAPNPHHFFDGGTPLASVSRRALTCPRCWPPAHSWNKH